MKHLSSQSLSKRRIFFLRNILRLGKCKTRLKWWKSRITWQTIWEFFYCIVYRIVNYECKMWHLSSYSCRHGKLMGLMLWRWEKWNILTYSSHRNTEHIITELRFQNLFSSFFVLGNTVEFTGFTGIWNYGIHVCFEFNLYAS